MSNINHCPMLISLSSNIANMNMIAIPARNPIFTQMNRFISIRPSGNKVGN